MPSHTEADAPPRRRWLRIAVVVVGIVALLVGAIWIAIVVAFPPERLAALLAEQVKSATGRDFRIAGGLSIRVLPTIAIQARDVALGNADWGSRPDMVTVRRAAIEVAPRALLEGELRIHRIDVEGVDALLESDGGGRYNWHFTPPASDARDAKPQPSDGRPSRFELERLVASDVSVTWRDGTRTPPRSARIESLDVRGEAGDSEIALAMAIENQRWTLEGRVGRVAILVQGEDDWPFDVRLAGDGAKLAAKGTLGTGKRPGTIVADVSGEVTGAAALAPLGASAGSVPLPLAVRGRVQHAGPEWRVDPLQVAIAGQALDGRMTFRSASPRPRLDATLMSKSIDLTKLGASTSTRRTTEPAKTTGPAKPVFGDTPLPITTVPGVDLQLDLRVESLRLPETPSLSSLRARLSSTPGRLSVSDVDFGVAGGRVRGRSNVVLASGGPPRLDVSIDAKSLSVEALDAAMAGGGHFRGGRVDLASSLAMSGATPRQLAASANGTVLLQASDATLVGGAAASLDRNILMTMLGLLIPKGSADRALAVQCLVVQLPLRNGVATIDRSIAAETRDVALVASGEINLVQQTLRLELRPTVKKGLGLNPANLATDFLEISGPLQDPQVGVGAKGAMRGAAKVGVGVATAGVSLLVPSVMGQAKDVSACAQAAAPAASARKP